MTRLTHLCEPACIYIIQFRLVKCYVFYLTDAINYLSIRVNNPWCIMGAWVVDLLKCKFTNCHSVTPLNRITALLRAVYFNEDDSISIIYVFVGVFSISCILLILHHIVLGLPTQHSLSLWHTHIHLSLLPRYIKSSNFVYCCVPVCIHVQHKLSSSKASLSNCYKGLSFRASF
jgi:hypothetical protein